MKRLTRTGWIGLATLIAALVLAAAACSPAAAPTPTPTKAPAIAPTSAPAAAPTKAPATAPTQVAQPTKPPAPSPAPATPTPKPASIKIGIQNAAGFVASYVADAKGYFREQGIEVEFVPFRTADELYPPLGTGQVDLIATTPGPNLLAAADRGLELKIVAGAMATAPGFETSWVLLRKDLADSGQVKTPADLKGMKVSIQSMVGGAALLSERMIKEAGLKPEDVERVVLTSSDVPIALSNKAIAAGFLSEPNIALAVQKGFGVKWLGWSKFFGGKMQTGVIIAGPSLLKNQDLARRWAMAYLKGSRYYLEAMKNKQGRDDVVQVLLKYAPKVEPEIYDIIEFPFVDPNGAVEKVSMDAQCTYSYKGTKTCADVTDLSILDYAVQKMGKQ